MKDEDFFLLFGPLLLVTPLSISNHFPVFFSNQFSEPGIVLKKKNVCLGHFKSIFLLIIIEESFETLCAQ